MKIEGYIEISEVEYYGLPEFEGIKVIDNSNKEYHYFKKVQKFPIVFEDDARIITVDKEGIRCKDKTGKDDIIFGYGLSFPLLVKAVEKAKEVMKKK